MQISGLQIITKTRLGELLDNSHQSTKGNIEQYLKSPQFSKKIILVEPTGVKDVSKFCVNSMIGWKTEQNFVLVTAA